MPHPLVHRLSIGLDRSQRDPLSSQIAELIWTEVVEGGLPSGARLPTVRQLAIGLEVSPRTVDRAYRELERLGVAHSKPGEGTFVSLKPPPEEERRRHRALARLCRETLDSARELGFDAEELLDTLRELRTLDEETP